MKTKNKAKREKPARALRALERYGKTRFCKTSKTTRGQRLGMAIYSLCDVDKVVDVAIEALEQWNCHLGVAVLSVLYRGQGSVERTGRKMVFELPEHWADIVCVEEVKANNLANDS